METTIKVTGKGSIHIVPDVTQLDITPDDLVSSEEVDVTFGINN